MNDLRFDRLLVILGFVAQYKYKGRVAQSAVLYVVHIFDIRTFNNVQRLHLLSYNGVVSALSLGGTRGL